MMTSIDMILDEYVALDPIRDRVGDSDIDWDRLNAALVTDCEWTSHAAETLTMLVQTYGSFVLRNAHALAIACEIEDGESKI